MTFLIPSGQLHSQAWALLSAHPLFDGIPQARLLDLLGGGCAVNLSEGARLFDETAPAEHWWLLLSGGVEMLRFGRDGEERVFGVAGAGSLIAEVAGFMPGRRYPVSARSCSPSQLYMLPTRQLRLLCEDNAHLAIRLLERATARLTQRIDEIERIAGMSAPERLADYLLRLSKLQGRSITLPISQRQLAATLGVRAETLSRLLTSWARSGLISGMRRQWCIQEPEHLQALLGDWTPRLGLGLGLCTTA